jgi:CRP/FNR family transcriptional regulator, cyclic AMP receptor protein
MCNAPRIFVAHLLARNARVRILLLLAQFGKDQVALEPVVPKISHEVLAEMVGTTRARVNL